ncbi:MAG: class II SORL domain-containing protein [Candidatus Omnitrophota bacterium]
MKDFNELLQTADWKVEKHVPVIDCPDEVMKGQFFSVSATIGKEIAHPNTTAHHIVWMQIYFLGEGDKFPYEIGYTNFSAHGASVQGADTSGIYTHHEMAISFKTDRPGTIYALSYCNIHGLWKNAKEIRVK